LKPIAKSTVGVPVISVIVPCYNQAEYLEELLINVASATAERHEVIIVDDGSTQPAIDRIWARLAPASDLQHVRLFRKDNGGLSAARNDGIEAASGRYIQFLDADDLLIPGSMDWQIRNLVTSSASVSVCNYYLCTNDRMQFQAPPEETIAHYEIGFRDVALNWERGMSIPIHCGLFVADSFREVRFETTLHAKEDWLFWMTYLSSGGSASYLPLRGAIYRQHPGSMTKRDVTKMGLMWLRAIELAGARLPEFEELAAQSALDHFKSFYLRHFWTKYANNFMPVYFSALCEDIMSDAGVKS
jgi:glycosyltransferase involved in cell wall biosynthesis